MNLGDADAFLAASPTVGRDLAANRSLRITGGGLIIAQPAPHLLKEGNNATQAMLLQGLQAAA